MRSVRGLNLRIVTLLMLAGLAALALAGCDAARSSPVAIFRPESREATAIHDLSVILLGIALVVLVGVEAALLVAVLRFRNRPESEVPQTHGNFRLEAGWTAATALAVVIILGMTVKTMSDVAAAPDTGLPMASAFPGDTLVLRVVGHQWWWSFEYPELNVVTANEVYVPVDRTVKLQLESDDVIHSFWAPRLGGKTDMIPGQINYSSFLATRPGVYEGACAEFCGLEHAHMGFKIIAVSPAEFTAWVKARQAPAAEPAADLQKAGEQAFLRSCGGCHAVDGTSASGRLGPDLTHFGSRQALGANMMENTPANLARWLRDPQAAKPGNKMPDLKLEEATVEQLVAYLHGLR